VIFGVFVAFSSAGNDTLEGSCRYAGQLIAEGEKFDKGCVGRCTCNKGLYGCVDLCPIGPPETPVDRHINIPGECCQVFTKVNTPCQEPTNFTITDDKSIQKFRRYPWSVIFCTDEKCSQRYGAIIISSDSISAHGEYLLTLSPKLSKSQSIYLVNNRESFENPESDAIPPYTTRSISNISVYPDFKDETGKNNILQVVKLNKEFPFIRSIFAANLPFDTDHCTNLTKDDCPLLTVGYGAGDDNGVLIGKKATKNGNGCKVTNANGKGEKRFCIGDFKDAKCTPTGGAILSTAGKGEFIVGLFDTIPDASNSCKQADSVDVLPLCKTIQWINWELKNDAI